ncbi:MAG: DUF934 domain-containing protein [Marivita sp.]|uniref:DUF934 domain-containing protein n=1 Tax=Marivita sp. TaxID=2003365 RepID=UPI003EF8A017
MTVLINDTGFLSHDPARWIDPEARVDLPSDTDPAQLRSLLIGKELVRIAFPSFADGRGFTLARMIRQQGYKGWLRAQGHVIADQYAMARRSGFDDVEIDTDLAARQPEADWLARADWQAHDYQARLRGRAA